MVYGNFFDVTVYYFDDETRLLDHKDYIRVPFSVCVPKNLRCLCTCLGATFLTCSKYGCRQFLSLEK